MDKSDKRARLRAWKEAELAKARAALPLADGLLERMFQELESALLEEPCDHSRRKTNAWLLENGCDVARVTAWLDDTSGYCDCEVVANSQDAWVKATGR